MTECEVHADLIEFISSKLIYLRKLVQYTLTNVHFVEDPITIMRRREIETVINYLISTDEYKVNRVYVQKS